MFESSPKKAEMSTSQHQVISAHNSQMLIHTNNNADSLDEYRNISINQLTARAKENVFKNNESSFGKLNSN